MNTWWNVSRHTTVSVGVSKVRPTNASTMSVAMSEQAATPALSVRPATRHDVPHILDMIQELAEYEGYPSGPQLTADDLLRDGFDTATPWFFGLIAERGGEVVGHALCNRAYSSWTCRAYYIEDLYVRPAARRRGVALRLLQELCRMAVRDGVHRIDWHVLENNAPALGFYSRLGAFDMHVQEARAAMRLPRDRIEALAADTAAPAPAP